MEKIIPIFTALLAPLMLLLMMFPILSHQTVSFAIWPAVSDQGYVQDARPGNNVISRCTAQLPFLANGGAIYGGFGNRIEDCLFTDIATGCGILISTTFPTSDEGRKIDNNFSGTTVIRHCELIRCGGDDHSWSWRGSLQICLDRRRYRAWLTSSHRR